MVNNILSEIITFKTDLETITKIYKFKSHHFSTMMQAGYLKKIKENIEDEVVIIILDFAENYTIKITNEIHTHHWNQIQDYIPFPFI